MRTVALCVLPLLVFVNADAPIGGYSYSRPSGGVHGGGGGGYIKVAPGPTTSEGQYVDGTLLEKIRQIILKEEASSATTSFVGGSGGGYPSSSYGVPSSSYGVPSSSYGVPSTAYITRVVGIQLEGIQQALLVAQYLQASSGGSYAVGYPSGSYGPPSSSYGVPGGFGGGYPSPA